MNSEQLVKVHAEVVGSLDKTDSEFIFTYSSKENQDNFISLTMPVRAKSYSHNKLHPIFEMHLPEGYLLSVIKKHISKLVDTDDIGLLKFMASSVRGRVSYFSKHKTLQTDLELNDLLRPANPNLFKELVDRFALTTPLSGVQPKVLAQVKDKATLQLEDYIVKSWGDDYPQLALNEYLCMQAVKSAGIVVPEFYLSDDDKLFIMKRFDVAKDGGFFGFEDMCVLQARQRDDKYKGSYEKVAKTIAQFTSKQNKNKALEQFFKITVMNYLLQNGDGHLKNFGLLYKDAQNVDLAPAYDIVCTTAYIKNDIPALMLAGSKRWHNQEALIEFGVNACTLNKKQAKALFLQCLDGIKIMESLITIRLKTEKEAEKINLLNHLSKVAKKVL